MYFATGEVYLANNNGNGVYRIDTASISTADLTVKVKYMGPSARTR
jgi:hypothetical protein